MRYYIDERANTLIIMQVISTSTNAWVPLLVWPTVQEVSAWLSLRDSDDYVGNIHWLVCGLYTSEGTVCFDPNLPRGSKD